ncbi:hypothetical protein CcI49_35755 [Frankia sp. CcI49]|nr:hypothetical protein CcI49_35755 [Frankia sp. CcI49]
MAGADPGGADNDHVDGGSVHPGCEHLVGCLLKTHCDGVDPAYHRLRQAGHLFGHGQQLRSRQCVDPADVRRRQEGLDRDGGDIMGIDDSLPARSGEIEHGLPLVGCLDPAQGIRSEAGRAQNRPAHPAVAHRSLGRQVRCPDHIGADLFTCADRGQFHHLAHSRRSCRVDQGQVVARGW